MDSNTHASVTASVSATEELTNDNGGNGRAVIRGVGGGYRPPSIITSTAIVAHSSESFQAASSPGVDVFKSPGGSSKNNCKKNFGDEIGDATDDPPLDNRDYSNYTPFETPIKEPVLEETVTSPRVDNSASSSAAPSASTFTIILPLPTARSRATMDYVTPRSKCRQNRQRYVDNGDDATAADFSHANQLLVYPSDEERDPSASAFETPRQVQVLSPSIETVTPPRVDNVIDLSIISPLPAAGKRNVTTATKNIDPFNTGGKYWSNRIERQPNSNQLLRMLDDIIILE